MKKILLAGAAAFALAACGGGGGDKATLVKSCVEDGEKDKAACGCMADVLQANLSKDTFKIAVKAAEAGDMESAELQTAMMGEFAEDPEKMMAFMGEMTACEAE